MLAKPATAAQIRKHYQDADFQCRISDGDTVEYRVNLGRRRNIKNIWLWGGYVSDYCVMSDGNVHLK